jgi:hypothetical protein
MPSHRSGPVNPLRDFDPIEILRVLERHGVRYVVIGALAAVAAGAPLVTEDLDVTPASDAENLGRLAGALADLDARLRTPQDEAGVAFPHDPQMLKTANVWTLVTRVGAVDLVFEPAGTRGFDDLRQDATDVELAPDVKVPVASLADVIRSKQAAARPKDLGQLPVLRATLERIRS